LVPPIGLAKKGQWEFADAMMEPKTSICNQDAPSSVAALRRVDATGFIRLNALRLKVAAKVQKRR
jgi:hypothetical protein